MPGQGNNVLVFPGLGFGAMAVKAKHIPDEFLVRAAKAVAGNVAPADIAQGVVYPDLRNLREVSLSVAIKVAECAFEMGIAQIPRPADLQGFLESKMWEPPSRAVRPLYRNPCLRAKLLFPLCCLKLLASFSVPTFTVC